jgi:hypothetical protein
MTMTRLIWTVFFVLLGAWAIYAGSRWFKPRRPWARARKVIFACDLMLAASCALLAAALAADWFRAWMLAPIGAVYAGAIFLPCSFPAVTRVRPLRLARNLLFAAIALFCLAVALGLVPLHYLGLE